METRQIWVSVDGGGTKTTICACNAQGRKIYERSFGYSNYKSSGLEAASNTLLGAFAQMMFALNCTKEEIVGIVMAIAGCDTEKDVEIYKNIMLTAGIDERRLFVCNDTEAIFRALSDEDGVCVVAGTGSIVCAYGADGLKARVGGWGCPLSDMGSGYWIGAQILQRVIRWYDGVNEDTLPVYEEIAAAYEKPQTELAWTLAGLPVSEVASVSTYVFRHAEQGDSLCRGIVQQAAEYIIEQIVALCIKAAFEHPFSIVTVGGIFRNDVFRNKVIDGVKRQLPQCRMEFLQPVSSPAEDGLRFAQKLYPAAM